MSERPDVVVVITDQERAAPPYESESVRSWRRRELVAHTWFAEHGTELRRHYAGSTACTPSRPTLLTGHYPDVHGVTQTTGIAKHADDPRMRWLRSGEVPTIGEWFGAGGYDVHYEGKWHVSDADLRDDSTGRIVATNDDDGNVIEQGVKRYLEEAPLSQFGFEGWVGPEPHGARPSNSGMVRDRITADRAIAWLEERDLLRSAGNEAALAPFLLIVCFVNPHDIVFWPQWARKNPLVADPADPPLVGDAPSQHDDLSDKPAIHAAYRRAYPTAYGPRAIVAKRYTDNAEEYRRTYYRLHLEVDRQIERVRQAVLAGQRANATTLVLTSDHGELLGSHGGLHQKWFNMFEETVRVPCFVVGPARPGAVYEEPTSHVDLLPTLLGVAGLDELTLASQLARTHSEVHRLVGRDLAPQLSGSAAPSTGLPVYMITRDDILEGADDVPLAKRRGGRIRRLLPNSIEPLAHVATNLEAVVVRSDGEVWKLIRVFDDPDTWSEPGVRHVIRRRFRPDEVRTRPLADQWELYNLSSDPCELQNMVRTTELQGLVHELRDLLKRTRQALVPPRNQPWPYASV